MRPAEHVDMRGAAASETGPPVPGPGTAIGEPHSVPAHAATYVPADLTTPNLTETWVKLHRRMPPLAGDGSNPALHAMIIM